MLHRVGRLQQIGAQFGVDIRAAAPQFPLAHPAVAGVIPGASQPGRIAENLAKVAIPPAFWSALREQGLVSPHAPLPID